jgi:hypothetical protein
MLPDPIDPLGHRHPHQKDLSNGWKTMGKLLFAIHSARATESQKTSSKNSSAPRPIASFHNLNVKSITAYQSPQNIPAIFQHKG